MNDRVLFVWNGIKGIPGYGWLYGKLGQIEDNHPALFKATALYLLMVVSTMIPVTLGR